MSELEHHLSAVAKRLEVGFHHVFEWRRTAVENNCVLAWSRELLFDQVSCDKAYAVAPGSLRLDINCVVEVEALWVI